MLKCTASEGAPCIWYWQDWRTGSCQPHYLLSRSLSELRRPVCTAGLSTLVAGAEAVSAASVELLEQPVSTLTFSVPARAAAFKIPPLNSPLPSFPRVKPSLASSQCQNAPWMNRIRTGWGGNYFPAFVVVVWDWNHQCSLKAELFLCRCLRSSKCY